MANAANAEDRLISTADDLLEPFHSACKPESEYRIGAEAEKIGLIFDPSNPGAMPRAIPYEGATPAEPSVKLILEELAARHGWSKDEGHGPLISLGKAGASVTLEPGAQLELSGAPLGSVHEIEREMETHISELHAISKSLLDTAGIDLRWLGIGFHPTARQADLTWVPKARYGVMKSYLPTRGEYGLDMMRRTATVQANFDYKSEEDAMTKLQVGLRVAPFFTAMFANSPYYEGKLYGGKSYRAKVWLSVDPERQGLVPRVLEGGSPKGFDDYVQWVLDAPMFLVLRDDGARVVENTGQTFRAFLRDGFAGERATMNDWVTHVNSMFPEVRLKRTLEVRGADSLPGDLVAAPSALFGGIFYDAKALSEAYELSESFSHDELVRLRPHIGELGVLAPFREGRVVDVATRLIDIARGGLSRRARVDANGKDEGRHLDALSALLSHGQCPADRLIAAAQSDESADLRTKLSAAIL